MFHMSANTSTVRFGVVGLLMMAWTAQAGAQSDPARQYEPPVSPKEKALSLPNTETAPPEWQAPVPDWLDYDSEPPYDWYERDWRYRMRLYRGTRFARDYYRPYGRYRGRYYRGPGVYDPYWGRGYAAPRAWAQWGDSPAYGYGYAPYGGGFAFDEGYVQGHRDGKRFAEWEFRYERGTRSYLDAMRTGVEAFNHGDYSTSSRQFILAAKLNQGDAASRLHAAHALVALGHYGEAALLVRRALQLQPKLVYLSLDIRSDYWESGDFTDHYQKLKEAADQYSENANMWFLLGYYQYFTDKHAEAVVSLVRANRLDPGQRTTQTLLEAARLSAPIEPETPKPGAEPKPNQPAQPVPAPAEPKPNQSRTRNGVTGTAV